MFARKMHFWIALVSVAGWGWVLCQPSYAGIEFSFGTDQDNYSVLGGSNVDVEVYLYETVTGGDSSLGQT